MTNFTSDGRPGFTDDDERTASAVDRAVLAALDCLDDQVDDRLLEHRLRAVLTEHVEPEQADGTETTKKAATGDGTAKRTPGPTDASDRPTSATALVDADELLDGLMIPGFVLAPEHTLVAYNDGFAELLGIEPGSAVGEDYRDVVSYAVYSDGRRELSLANKVVEAPRSADERYESVDRVDDQARFTGDYVYEDTSTMRNRLGEEIPIGFLATPIFDAAGELAAVLEIVDERDSELEEFPGLAGIISHDLRNPLDVVQTYTELAAEDIDDDHYEHIRSNLDRIENIIEDVMALSKQATVDQNARGLNLGTLARQAWETVETPDADLDAEQVPATGDRAQLLRLFENLLRNAIEHGGADVTVRVGPLADREGFFLEDDGVGIPPDERDAVLEHGHSTDDGGTGFGLSIVHQIVQNHGWEMVVTESEADGARFEFTFE